MSFGMRATWKSGKGAVGSPTEFAHADFGRVVGASDPLFQVFKVAAHDGAGVAGTRSSGNGYQQTFLLLRRQSSERFAKFCGRFGVESGERAKKFLLSNFVFDRQ